MMERAGFRLSCIGVALVASMSVASAGPAGGASGPALGAARGGPVAAAPGGAIGRMAGHRGFGRHPGAPYRMRQALGWRGFFDPGFGGGGSVVVVGITQEAVEPPVPGIPVVVGIARPPEASPVLYRIEGGKGGAAPRVIRLDADGSRVSSGARIVPVKGR